MKDIWFALYLFVIFGGLSFFVSSWLLFSLGLLLAAGHIVPQTLADRHFNLKPLIFHVPELYRCINMYGDLYWEIQAIFEGSEEPSEEHIQIIESRFEIIGKRSKIDEYAESYGYARGYDKNKKQETRVTLDSDIAWLIFG